MSPTISASAAAALPAVNFHPHGHHRGAHADIRSGSAGAAGSAGNATGATFTGSALSCAVGTIGQLPIGAAAGLFGHLLQSLMQSAAARTNPSDRT